MTAGVNHYGASSRCGRRVKLLLHFKVKPQYTDAGGRCRGQMKRADAGGRCRRQMQEADEGGRCRGQMQGADAGGRCRRKMQGITVCAGSPYHWQ